MRTSASIMVVFTSIPAIFKEARASSGLWTWSALLHIFCFRSCSLEAKKSDTQKTVKEKLIDFVLIHETPNDRQLPSKMKMCSYLLYPLLSTSAVKSNPPRAPTDEVHVAFIASPDVPPPTLYVPRVAKKKPKKQKTMWMALKITAMTSQHSQGLNR